MPQKLATVAERSNRRAQIEPITLQWRGPEIPFSDFHSSFRHGIRAYAALLTS
jgi:hypothetical protein